VDQAALKSDKIRVVFTPRDTETRVPPGTTLFHAAAWIGQPVESTCGGRGTCGKCKVRIVEGSFPVTPADQHHLKAEERDTGWRLSCQAEVHGETVAEVPRLLGTPKTAMFGVGRQVLLDPNVHKVHLKLQEPELHDQRSDLERLRAALEAEGYPLSADLQALRLLPSALRQADFDVTVVLCGADLVAVEAGDTTREAYGAAFDLGTTTIVGTLIDLVTGEAKAVASSLNAQAVHGGDVLSRISYTMSHPGGLMELQRMAAMTFNTLLEDLRLRTGVAAERLYEVTVAGNATMQHLLLGLDPEPISVTPFAPTLTRGFEVRSDAIGFDIHPNGRVYLFPHLGAYVGGDIVAGLLATALPRGDRPRLFVDVGTNGEIALGYEKRTVATAAPAGPAFEGAECAPRGAPSRGCVFSTPA
jgi:uncharacterized 2Fe-2S/4Fe-4S cluster protein (DUF4445 family)